MRVSPASRCSRRRPLCSRCAIASACGTYAAVIYPRRACRVDGGVRVARLAAGPHGAVASDKRSRARVGAPRSKDPARRGRGEGTSSHPPQTTTAARLVLSGNRPSHPVSFRTSSRGGLRLVPCIGQSRPDFREAPNARKPSESSDFGLFSGPPKERLSLFTVHPCLILADIRHGCTGAPSAATADNPATTFKQSRKLFVMKKHPPTELPTVIA